MEQPHFSVCILLYYIRFRRKMSCIAPRPFFFNSTTERSEVVLFLELRSAGAGRVASVRGFQMQKLSHTLEYLDETWREWTLGQAAQNGFVVF